MITLRPITANEFPTFAAYFVPDYAAEIVANYGGMLADALSQAAQDLKDDLPQGADTPGEILMCIVNAGAVIGYLFYALNPATKSAFIKDFHVLPPHQGRGHGTAALAALTAQLKPHGITQIRLRVAAKNAAAHRLYTKLGFFPTGINMAKNL
jgi:ribosomal protein S18 acetylase RimI-like enzyme